MGVQHFLGRPPGRDLGVETPVGICGGGNALEGSVGFSGSGLLGEGSSGPLSEAPASDWVWAGNTSSGAPKSVK